MLDRDDDCITLCEIKHTEKNFAISKSYSKEIETKQAIFKEQSRTKKQIQWCLIVSNDVARNEYFKALINHVVVLDDLFK